MKGYIQVMQLKAKGNDNGFVVKALDGAERQITKMTNMINGFLNISRFESGKMFMDLQRIEFSAIVEEIIEEYTTTGSNHEISYSGEPGLLINADRNKLGHVINNLIGNAVKYSPGCAEIEVKLWADATATVHLEVADQGIGIRDDEKLRIFDKFYRVGSEDTRKTKGTGLGLYIVKQVLDNHQEQIKVKNNRPAGSIFEVTFNTDGN